MAKKQQEKTYVSIVLDRSSSMAILRDKVIEVFNHLTKDQVEQAEKNNIDIRLSLFTFADYISTLYVDAGPKSLTPLDRDNYKPHGWTALMDGVKEAIDQSSKMHDAKAAHVSHLVMVLTDGFENQSRHINQAQFAALIKEKQDTGDWTFAFYVPPGNKAALHRDFGVPLGNIMEWEQSAKGVDDVDIGTRAASASYYGNRSKGVKSTASFFVHTDLSSLDTKELRKKLQDQQAYYQSYAVPKEVEIRPFVEEATGKPYLSGTAFYQLTKDETVQWRKDVLIREKGKKAVWGGDEARQLIGLPKFGDAKVKPGNHANFDIFVQSTSTNRKLVRGTTVLVRK